MHTLLNIQIINDAGVVETAWHFLRSKQARCETIPEKG
jgi:hypothetical protein